MSWIFESFSYGKLKVILNSVLNWIKDFLILWVVMSMRNSGFQTYFLEFFFPTPKTGGAKGVAVRRCCLPSAGGGQGFLVGTVVVVRLWPLWGLLTYAFSGGPRKARLHFPALCGDGSPCCQFVCWLRIKWITVCKIPGLLPSTRVSPQ